MLGVSVLQAHSTDKVIVFYRVEEAEIRLSQLGLEDPMEDLRSGLEITFSCDKQTYSVICYKRLLALIVVLFNLHSLTMIYVYILRETGRK